MRILVKAGTPPDDRLNQVRNDRLILHHCYLNLNVERIIRQISSPPVKLANYLRYIESLLGGMMQVSALSDPKQGSDADKLPDPPQTAESGLKPTRAALSLRLANHELLSNRL